MIGPARFEGLPFQCVELRRRPLAVGAAARRGQPPRVHELLGLADDEVAELVAEGVLIVTGA